MREWLLQFMSRDAVGLAQFVKYVATGLSATAMDVVIFYTLAWKVVPALRPSDPLARLLRLTVKPVTEEQRSRRFVWLSMATFIFTTTYVYLVNIFWIFTPGRHPWYIEALLFYGVSVLGVAVGTFTGWLLIRKLHLSTTVSYVAKGVASLMLNFVCRKFIIFSH